MAGGLLIESPRREFRSEIAIEHLFDGLTDVEWVEHLHVGKAIEEDDALDELVRVLHLLDRFLAPLFGERLVAPVVEQAVVQPILVDGGQLVPQPPVEELDDARLTAHVVLRVADIVRPCREPARRSARYRQKWEA